MTLPRLTLERRLLVSAAVCFGVPMGLMLAMPQEWQRVRLVGPLALLAVAAFAAVLRWQLSFPLRTLANVLGALREADYSIRVHPRRDGSALGELHTEIELLTERLRAERVGAQEAETLVNTVLAEIDSAILAFDDLERIQLANRAAARLMARNAEQLLGRHAAELGLEALLEGPLSQSVEYAFPGATGRWLVRRSRVLRRGRAHRLLLITDVGNALRQEERAAWQRLVRVLGHEINNSLAPVQSITATLLENLEELPSPEELRSGLEVVHSRTASLARFMDGYARLARLPPPTIGRVELYSLAERVARLEQRMPVTIAGVEEIVLLADPDQLEALLINLTRNAVDASLDAGGTSVSIGWRRGESFVEVAIDDDGAGIVGTSNLFTPFFTTKPNGSGIGLALSRMIAEAHGGTLRLESRAPHGATALLLLPI